VNFSESQSTEFNLSVM